MATTPTMPTESPRLDFAGGTLTLWGLSPARLSQSFAPGTWTWDRRAGVWRADAMRYAAVRNRLSQSDVAFSDRVPAWREVRWPAVRLPELRPQQRQAVEAWLAKRRGCVVMPTGTGKTEVALAAMARIGKSCLVVAPVRDLMYQWHRRIHAALGYDAGIVGDNVYRVKPVSVTTYESAYLHMGRLGARFAMVVFDECHHLPAAARRDAARMCAAPWRLGLTATPERGDGRHDDLNELVGAVVYQMPFAEARGRDLAEFDVVRIPVELSPAERARYERLSAAVRRFVYLRRKDDPDFAWEDVCRTAGEDPQAGRAYVAFQTCRAIEDRADGKVRVLEDLFGLHAGEPVLVFAGSNAMARDISRRFLIPCLLSHCRKRERRDYLTRLASGDYPALVANRILDEGVDLPEVKVAIVVGGAASTRQAQQRLGRVLRKRGAARATLYEVVTAQTGDVERSRRRRRNDAYQRTRHRPVRR